MKNFLVTWAAAISLGLSSPSHAEIPKMDKDLFTSKMVDNILWNELYAPNMIQPQDFFDTLPKWITKDGPEIEGIMDELLKKQAQEAQERHKIFIENSDKFLDLIDKWFLHSSNLELPLVWLYQNHMNISTVVRNKDNISPNSKEVLQKLFWEVIDLYSAKVSKRWDTENYQKQYDFSKEKPEIFLHMMYLSMSIWESSIFMLWFHPEKVLLPNWEAGILIIEITWNSVSISHWDFNDELLFNMK